MISTLGWRVQARSVDVPDMATGPHGRAVRACCVVLRGSGLGRTDHVRLRTLLPLRDLELDALPLLEGAVAVHLDRAVVDENVRATVDSDEAVALLAVEPLDGALSHRASPAVLGRRATHRAGPGSCSTRPGRGGAL